MWRKTVETVVFSLGACATSLKRGVNERGARRGREDRSAAKARSFRLFGIGLGKDFLQPADFVAGGELLKGFATMAMF